MAADDSVLDWAEAPRKPVDPFRHSTFHSSLMDVVGIGCLVAATYFLVVEGNIIAFLLLFLAFAFMFQPFHPH